MERFELYDQIPFERRQAIILGLDKEIDAVSGDHTVNSPQLCVLVVEWTREGKMPSDDESINRYCDALKISRLQDINPATRDDIMFHIIKGISGEAFDEDGVITLRTLCDYVNSKLRTGNNPSNNLLSVPSRDLEKIILREHPENRRKSIVDHIQNFYNYLQEKRINGFVNAADELHTLMELGVREKFQDILQSEFTFCMKANYSQRLKVWENNYYSRVTKRINELIVLNQKEWAGPYVVGLNKLKSVLERRFKKLGKYLRYNEFDKFLRNEQMVFIDICDILDEENLRNRGINYNVNEDPIMSLINNFTSDSSRLDVKANLQKSGTPIDGR